MGADDKVLSQAEIDALLNSTLVPKAPPAPKTAAAAAPKSNVAAPVPPKAAAAPVPAAAPKATAPPSPASPAPVAAKPAPPAAAPAPAPVSTPAPAPQQVIQQGPSQEQVNQICRQLISTETKDLAKQIVELTIKVGKIETVKKRMDEIDDKVNQLIDMMQSSPDTSAIEAMQSRMDELYSLLQGMRRRSSDEEHIRDQFHCVKCHSEKLVAIQVKCTNCGTENWMGWFPDKNEEAPPEHY